LQNLSYINPLVYEISKYLSMIRKGVAELIPYKPFGLSDIERLKRVNEPRAFSTYISFAKGLSMIRKAVAELILYKPFGLSDIERLKYDKESRCRTYPI
jgi:hypothetical protein